MCQQRHDPCDHQHGPVPAWDRGPAECRHAQDRCQPQKHDREATQQDQENPRSVHDTGRPYRPGSLGSERLIRGSRPVSRCRRLPGSPSWPIVHGAIPLMPPIRASNGPRIVHPDTLLDQQAACGQNGRRIFLGGHVPMPVRYRVPTTHRVIPSLPIVPGRRKSWSSEPMHSAVWSLTLTSGFYFVNGNVRFSSLDRFRFK
jgi:hypothetical protein